VPAEKGSIRSRASC